MDRTWQDIRYAVRAAGRTKSVSILAILAFALGIGVTTAVFSIFNGVLLAPLPFPDPDELVAVYGTQPACATCPASFPKYYDWKTRNRVFAAMGGYTQASFALTGRGAACGTRPRYACGEQSEQGQNDHDQSNGIGEVRRAGRECGA